jgi:zinc protease
VQHTLENGLQVILQENHSAPVVALQVWVDVGSADDPEETSGLAHILEHMVFKGTARRSEGQIAREIEGAGGQINAWTSFDQTVFHVVLPSRHFSRGLDILADALQHARFDAGELERELQVILEEIKQGEDSPSKVVSRELFRLAYQRHPYGRPVIGSAPSVRGVDRARVERFFRTWFNPSNMTLVIVGDFHAGSALTKIRRTFPEPRRARPPARRRATEPVQTEPRILVRARDTQEAHLSIAFHIPSLMDPATPALDLAAIVLGQGDSSRLIRKVKHEQQLVTDVYAYSYTPREPGILIVGATTTPDKLAPAFQAILTEALALGSVELTSDELRRAKTIIESDAVYQKETVQGQARKLGFYRTVAGSVEFEQEYYRRATEATVAQVRQVAAQHLHADNLSVAVLSPLAKGREARVEKELGDAIRAARLAVRRAGGEEQKGDERVVKVTLANGARLLVARDRSVPLVALRAVWNGGLRYETAENNGVNNLLAALVTRGTATRSADQINEAIESMAGAIGGFSGLNSFGLRAELLARHWEQGLEILADCALNPAFKPAEVDRERRQVLDDIRAQQDNLSAVALQLFSRTIFRAHPYRMDPLGSLESVSALRRDALVAYYRRHFRPGNLVLSVVGDVDLGRVKERFAALFGGARRAAVAAPSPPREPTHEKPAQAVQLMNKQQAHLVVGYPGTDMKSRDRYALEVLASILSGQGGRLFLELRDRKGLAYQVGAYSQEGLEPGYFAVYLATSPQKIEASLEGIGQELARLRDRPVSDAELKRIQRYLVGSYEISLQRKSTLASLLAFNECYGLGYQAYARYVDLVMAVTAKDVQRVARRYLDEGKRVVAIVKPEELSPGAAKRLGEEKQAGVATGSPPPAMPKKKPSRKRAP